MIFSAASRPKSLGALRERTLAVLDVGSSKAAVLVATVGSGGDLRVIGYGHTECHGVRGGLITDMDKAERSIRTALDIAERMSGTAIDKVYVIGALSNLYSEIVGVDVDLNGHAVEQADIDRALAEGRNQIVLGNRDLLHALPAAFWVDNARDIQNPEGLFGQRLGVEMHVIAAETGPLRNLEACVHNASVGVIQVIATPVATGYGCLAYEEKQLGVACIEIGAGVTTVSIFAGGMMVGCATIPIGGSAITQDIARILMTPEIHAERIKTLHGVPIAVPADNHDMIEVPPLVAEEGMEPLRVPKSYLCTIIRARLEEIFTEVHTVLEGMGFTGPGASRVVLTGGVAQLPGINHFAQSILNKSIRTGRPMDMAGLPDVALGPGFSALVGALRYAVSNPKDARQFSSSERLDMPRGSLARMGRWLRATF